MTAYKYWVSGITCHIYSREERTRLTGEINDMSAFIPGAERYFRRSLHVKNCRDRLIISSGFQEKGGCPLIRACSVITSNTVSTSTEDFPEMYLSTFQVLYKLYLSTDVLKYKVLLPGSAMNMPHIGDAEMMPRLYYIL